MPDHARAQFDLLCAVAINQSMPSPPGSLRTGPRVCVSFQLRFFSGGCCCFCCCCFCCCCCCWYIRIREQFFRQATPTSSYVQQCRFMLLSWSVLYEYAHVVHEYMETLWQLHLQRSTCCAGCVVHCRWWCCVDVMMVLCWCYDGVMMMLW